MSLKHKTLVGLFLALMSGIGSVVAATVPGTVDDIDMVLTQEGGVAVSWSPASQAAMYRVYFSRESILESQGDYDDFVETAGTETTYIFSKYPVSGMKMFAAVLAVSDDGTESEGFVSEASLDLPEVMSSSSSAEVIPEIVQEVVEEPVVPVTTSKPLAIDSVMAISQTGVIVHFTKPILTDLSVNPFVLTETGGEVLRIVSAQILDTQTILLTTNPQKPMQKYLFGLVSNITAEDGTSMTTTSPRILFDSFVMGTIYIKNPITGGPAPVINNVPAFTGPTLVELESQKEKDGTYTITASWTPVTGVMGYAFHTTTDGSTFTKVGTAGPAQTSARFRKVTAASFGVKVVATSNRGAEAETVSKMLVLTAAKDTPLTNSGLPILGVMLAAGAAAGSRLKWRKKKC